MRSVISGVLVLAAAVAVLLIHPSRAWASTTWGCTGSRCQVGVGTPASGPDAGSGAPGSNYLTSGDPGASSGPCPPGQQATYDLQTEDGRPVTAQPGNVNPITDAPVAPGSELEAISCNGNYLTTVVIPPTGGPNPPPVTGVELARRALSSFEVAGPAPDFSPATSVVGVRTWLWLRGGWSSRSATASVPGLSATVTARPTNVVWNMGDGQQTVCDGPGKAWDPNQPNATTDCSYTYSAAGHFTVTVTVNFTTTWSASDGTAGRLGAITGRTTVPITVDEIQAVNDN
jgi:hypothetical protein